MKNAISAEKAIEYLMAAEYERQIIAGELGSDPPTMAQWVAKNKLHTEATTICPVCDGEAQVCQACGENRFIDADLLPLYRPADIPVIFPNAKRRTSRARDVKK